MAGSAPPKVPFEVHLVDGTYELFRHHFAVPSHIDPDGMEVAAARGVMSSVLMMLEQGATHVGVATDHVIESFRNDLYRGYKTSEGMPPELLSQFTLLEDGLHALGVTVWPMVDQEADDGLAAATWRVHAPARIAVLDARFARACGRWPTVAEAVGARHARRAQALARRLAVAQLPAITDRLLLIFCELAMRWGRVTPDGIRLPVPLTHSTLAALVGARRPSVTTALGILASQGLIERIPGGWMLHGDIERLASRVEDPALRSATG